MSSFISPTFGNLEARAQTVECHSDRAGDYFGLGIRMGVYFAWLNAYLCHTLLPSGIGSAASANTVFLLTLFAALAKDSMRDHLTQVDALVLMHLCGGATFGIISIWGYRTRLYTDKGPKAVGFFGSYGTHIRVFISFAISAYGLWFWSYGVVGGLNPLGPNDGMESGKNSEQCSNLYTFFFAKVRADQGIRFYYIIVCAACTLYFGAMMFASSLSLWFSLERLLGIAGDRWAHTAHVDTMMRPRYATGFSDKELKMMYKVLRVLNPIWLIWSIITIECTLNFNNLKGVLGGEDNDLSKPGQLLPFLVGGFGFVETLYRILKEKVFQKDFHDAPEAYRGFGPSVLRSTTDMEKNQQTHSWALRYLVGWLPWLSLLHSYDKELSARGISRSNTGLGSPETPGFPKSQSPWSPTVQQRMSMPPTSPGMASPGASSFMSVHQQYSHQYAPAPMTENPMSPSFQR